MQTCWFVYDTAWKVVRVQESGCFSWPWNHLQTLAEEDAFHHAEPDDNLQTDIDSSLVRSSKDLRGRSNPEKLAKSSGENRKRQEKADFGDADRDPEAGRLSEDEDDDVGNASLYNRTSDGAEVSNPEATSKPFTVSSYVSSSLS